MAFGSKQQWNGRSFFMCLMVSLGQIAFGYPASIIGVTLAQPSFLIYMGLLDVTQDPPVMTQDADEMIGAISGVGLSLSGARFRLTSQGISSWGCFRRLCCKLGRRQMGPQNGLSFLWLPLALGRRALMWKQKHRYVHCRSNICWSWKLGLSVH